MVVDRTMKELTDQQICKLVSDAHRGYGDPLDLKQLSNAAYALGREAGLKEAAEVCEKTYPEFTKTIENLPCFDSAQECADAIRALIAALGGGRP
jgi:CO dehydrogenase/acetyl-CoA synthase alpha subunit